MKEEFISTCSMVDNNSVDYNAAFFCLPDWIAGRYSEEEQLAIVFNNLVGETYLFEGPTARLWRELLKYDYLEHFNLNNLCKQLRCQNSDLLSFFSELIHKNIIINHVLCKEELNSIKTRINKNKNTFLRSAKGIGNHSSVLDSADNDFGNRTSKHGIPFSATIELTYACDEACIHCYNPGSPRNGNFNSKKPLPLGEMEAEDYFPVLDSLARMGVAKIVFTGGDPFMKKDVMRILAYTHKLKFAFS